MANFLRLEQGDDLLELSVSGYEFENGQGSDADWLMLSGKYCVNGCVVEGCDPTLTVSELLCLREKLHERLAQKSGSFFFSGMEPNFFVHVADEETVEKSGPTLSVFFFPERSLREQQPDFEKMAGLYTQLEEAPFTKPLTEADLEALASWCDLTVNEFPARA